MQTAFGWPGKTFNNTLGPGGRVWSDLLDPYIDIKTSSRYELTSAGMEVILSERGGGVGL